MKMKKVIALITITSLFLSSVPAWAASVEEETQESSSPDYNEEQTDEEDYSETIEEDPILTEEESLDPNDEAECVDSDTDSYMYADPDEEDIESDPIIVEESEIEESYNEPEVICKTPKFSSDTEETGENDISYTLNEEGVLDVYGSGILSDSFEDIEHNKIKTVTIHEGFTEIGEGLFDSDFKYSNISTIIIEQGICKIGKRAFCACSNLTKISIPDSIESIGENAFYGLSNLETIDYNGTRCEFIVRYGQNTGLSDKALKLLQAGHFFGVPEVTSPGSETEAGFYHVPCLGCDGGYQFSFYTDGTNASIEKFYNSPYDTLVDIIIPETIDGSSVIRINAFAFGAHSGPQAWYIRSISIPNSVKEIGSNAFYRCTSLKTVNLPNGLELIGAGAFEESGLTSITIPDSVTDIGVRTFQDCKDLQSVVLPANLKTIPYNAFCNCINLKNIVFPRSLTHIGDSAFSGCFSLEAIELPDTIQKIGSAAFYDCKKLLHFTVPNHRVLLDNSGFGFEYSNVYAESRMIPGFSMTGFAKCSAQDYAIENNIPYTIKKCDLNYVIPFCNLRDITSREQNLGKPVKKKEKIVLKGSGHTFTEGEDFSVAYANNNKDGIADIILTGKGDFSGTYTLHFEIYSCSHRWGEWYTSKKATTTTQGKQIRECCKCGIEETKTIKMLQPLTVKGKRLNIKASKVKKKKQVIAKIKAFSIKNAKGKLTFKKITGSKKLSVSNTGKITVKKGTKKGTYKIKIKITAKGNDKYQPGSKTVMLKIIVA